MKLWSAFLVLLSAAAITVPKQATAHDWHTPVFALPCGVQCPGWPGAEAMGGYDPCARPYEGTPNFYDEVIIRGTLGYNYLRYAGDDRWDVWACNVYGWILNTPWDPDCFLLDAVDLPIPCRGPLGIRLEPGNLVILRTFNMSGLPNANLHWMLEYH